MDIGARLREAREARGISLEDLAQRTRVQPRLLAAIESNDIARVPPRPYGRGFVRGYAREVGLDPDTTVTQYFAQFEPIPGPPASDRGPSDTETSPWGSPLVAVVVLALIAGLALWAGWQRGRTPLPEPQSVGTTGAIAPALVRAGENAPVERAVVSRPVTEAAEPIVVAIETDGPAWVAATADGKRLIYRLLPAGARETISATGNLTIRVGDAGAVRWSVNGRSIGRMGDPGETRTAVVTPDNVSAIR
jgi:cytoskeleton protein RodZ